jgi:hypothetical protein
MRQGVVRDPWLSYRAPYSSLRGSKTSAERTGRAGCLWTDDLLRPDRLDAGGHESAVIRS